MSAQAPLHPALNRILLDEATLKTRIKELGAQITRDYNGRRLMVVGVLKGSVIFLADLLRALGSEVDVEMDFVAVSSYAGKASTGSVRTLLDLRESPDIGLASSIKGRSPMIDGFGLIAFASLTPIIFVMGYGMLI